MKSTYLLLGAFALVFQATPVLAGHHEDKAGGKMFEHQDTNGDGMISKDEFMKHAEERFMKMDADGNGSISKEEAKEVKYKAKEKMKEMKDKWKEKKEY